MSLKVWVVAVFAFAMVHNGVVVAESRLMFVNEFGLFLNKCRLFPGTEKKPK